MKARGKKEKQRCHWATTHALLQTYHDDEWGVPVHGDRRLFEMLNLEAAQAGLSWLTVLKKRDNYRRAFDRFDPKKIAAYRAPKRAALLQNAGIIRNRLKIGAFIQNAKAFLEIQRELGSFDRFIWSFVDGKPLPRARRAQGIPISDVMSKSLKRRGFKFVGPTICYAFMQAVGMVNDHTPECFRA